MVSAGADGTAGDSPLSHPRLLSFSLTVGLLHGFSLQLSVFFWENGETLFVLLGLGPWFGASVSVVMVLSHYWSNKTIMYVVSVR